MREHYGRRWIYRNRKHWALTLGRYTIERWCPGAPCGLLSVRYTPHAIGFVVWPKR